MFSSGWRTTDSESEEIFMSRGLIDDSPARARRRDLETLIHSEQASWIGIRDSGT
jgi:hypothetical protein